MTVKDFREMLKGVDPDAQIVFIELIGKPPHKRIDPVRVQEVNGTDRRGAVVSHVVVSLKREGKRNER